MNIKSKERIINYSTIFLIFLTLILLASHYKETIKGSGEPIQLKLNLRTLQVAFENYHHDNSTYPPYIKDLDSLRNILSSYIENEEMLNFEIESYEVTAENYKLKIRTNDKIAVVTPEKITIKDIEK